MKCRDKVLAMEPLPQSLRYLRMSFGEGFSFTNV
jgi:hypothetical protein